MEANINCAENDHEGILQKAICSFNTYDSYRYGIPWVCLMNPDGSYNFQTKIGRYGSDKGREGDLLVDSPQKGRVYGYGQKDYRGSNSLIAYARWDGEKFIECDRTGTPGLPHIGNGNEKAKRTIPILEDNPVREAANRERLKEDPVPLYPYPVKTSMYKHQIRGANMAMLTMGLINPGKTADMESRDPGISKEIPLTGYIQHTHYGFSFLFEMGCGKSLTAIAVMGAAYRMKKIKKVLVVAPASVCSVWKNELSGFAGFPFSSRILTGTKDQRLKSLAGLKDAVEGKDEDKNEENSEDYIPGENAGEDPLKIAIINYESVWRPEMYKEIESWCPDMVIADESQRIKSLKAKQSKAMHKLGRMAKYRLILSGTPIQNNALDLFSQYLFLAPEVFGNNFFEFRSRYAVMGGYEGREVIGYKNLDELIRREYDIGYRVTKKDALDLPEQVFETIPVHMDRKTENLYNKLVESCIAELEEEKTVKLDNVLTKLLRLQQFTGGFLKTDEAPEPEKIFDGKLDALSDILEDHVISSGKKLVIFCRFKAEIKAIKELLEKKKIKYGCIYGEVSMQDRGDIVSKFQTDPETKVFLAQEDTAGLGITLTAADTAVYYSVNYNYASYAQSLARIHRIGQHNTCTYIHLVCEGTVDEKVLEALQCKEETAKLIVDDWKKYFKKAGRKAKKSAAAARPGQTDGEAAGDRSGGVCP